MQQLARGNPELRLSRSPPGTLRGGLRPRPRTPVSGLRLFPGPTLLHPVIVTSKAIAKIVRSGKRGRLSAEGLDEAASAGESYTPE
jgi:hypothetical protein